MIFLCNYYLQVPAIVRSLCCSSLESGAVFVVWHNGLCQKEDTDELHSTVQAKHGVILSILLNVKIIWNDLYTQKHIQIFS